MTNSVGGVQIKLMRPLGLFVFLFDEVSPLVNRD